jgi:hypothetical protein
VGCYRHWDAGQTLRPFFWADRQQDRPGGLSYSPKLFTAIHAENFGINFRSDEDDYVQCEAADSESWTIDNVLPEAGGFAAAPVSVLPTPEGHWRCNFKLPPGLPAGWHEVRVRRTGSEWSNAVRIAVDLPERADSLETVAVCDAFDWTRDSFSLRHRFFSMWLRGLPENADRANVKVELSGAGPCPAYRQSVDFVGDADINGLRQINVLADARIAPGRYRVQAEFGGARSAEIEIEATLP